MKNKLVVFSKSFLITIFVLIFLILMAIVVNEGEKKLTGEGVEVYGGFASLCIKKGSKEYLIKRENEKVIKLFNRVALNPAFLPAPFNFALLSNDCLKMAKV